MPPAGSHGESWGQVYPKKIAGEKYWFRNGWGWVVKAAIFCHTWWCKAPIYCVACPGPSPPRPGNEGPRSPPPEARAFPYVYPPLGARRERARQLSTSRWARQPEGSNYPQAKAQMWHLS
ncbi:hypothetical protein GCM10025785_21310 [Corynebacterium canis]